MNILVKTLATGILGLAALTGTSCLAAQRDLYVEPVSFGFVHTDVRVAITSLFQAVGANCSFESGIQGRVTFTLVNKPFSTALQKLLDLNGLTYRSEGSVMQIVRKVTRPTIEATEVSRSQVESLKCQDADVHKVLRELFRRARLRYSVDPDIEGLLSVQTRGSFDSVLATVLREVGATFEVREGKYWISREIFRNPGVPLLVDGTNIALVQADKCDAQPLLCQLFGSFKTPFVVAGVCGIVTFRLKNFPFDSTLHLILSQAGARCTETSGVRIVQPMLPPTPISSPVGVG